MMYVLIGQPKRLGGFLLACATLILATPAQAASVSGEAFGASVSAASATLAKTPDVAVDATKGVTTGELASVSVANILSTGTLETSASGVVAENSATTETRATVQSVNILGGAVKADLVVAMASSASNGKTAESNAAGSTFVNLVVNGKAITGPVAANTRISIPGVATVILNEQSTSGDGTDTSGITVNMIHVQLLSLLGLTVGDVVVASASSSVGFP